MEQLDCEIVQDLLPLYHDGVCSAGSRAAVEAHLETCRSCRTVLADLDAPLPGAEQAAADDAAAVKKISKKWKSATRRAWIKGAAIGALVCIVLAAGAWLLDSWTCIPMDRGECYVEVYQLENGDVGVHWDFNATWSALTFEDRADGTHWRMERPILRTTIFNFDNKAYSSSEDALFSHEEGTVYLDLGAESILLIQDGRPAPNIPAATPEQAALWQEGMDLPAASAQSEALYGAAG